MKWGLWLAGWILFASWSDARVSILADKPDWSLLDKYREKMTKTEFETLLNKVYAPREAWRKGWVEVTEKAARIRKEAGKDEWYELPFGDDSDKAGDVRPVEYWRPAEELREAIGQGVEKSGKTLSGARIALDAGHLGGKYAEMENRNFAIEGSLVVKEGDLALAVAKMLAKRLRKKGALVSLVRESARPVTSDRPETLRKQALLWQNRIDGSTPPKRSKEEFEKLIARRSEILFFRTAEIMARARRVNEKLKPDFVVCIHLNAAPWPDPEKLSLVGRNDYHVLVNGAYMGGEVALDNQRLDMLLKLLNRSHYEERALAESMARAFAAGTGLPAFAYKGPNAVKVGVTPGVWGRNLMANRLYLCPVLFLEPYVANSKEVHARILAGDYEGLKEVAGKKRPSLLKEYADAVEAALTAHLGRSEAPKVAEAE